MHHNALPRQTLVVDAAPEKIDSLVGDIMSLLADAGFPARRLTSPAVAGSPAGDSRAGDSRAGATEPDEPVAGVTVTVGDLVVCADARIARRAGQRLDLTRIEFDLLVEFLRNRNRVLTKDALLASVWNHEPVTPNAIEARVSRLRAKLEQAGPRVIHTVRGVGYVLHAVPTGGAADGRTVVELVSDDAVLDLVPYGTPWPAGGRQ
jgi:DNA-binding winged helix-turn-helix (wHTH) protein